MTEPKETKPFMPFANNMENMGIVAQCILNPHWHLMQSGPHNAKVLLPYAVQAVRSDEKELEFGLLPIAKEIVREYLKITYGNIEQTGFFESCNIHGEGAINLQEEETATLRRFVPQLQVIANLRGSKIAHRTNAWYTAFALPVEDRDFFAHLFTEEECFKQWDQAKESRPFYKPFSLDHILKYAEPRNELAKVPHYMDVYTAL